MGRLSTTESTYLPTYGKHDVPSPVSPHDVGHTHCALNEVMLQTMKQVNTSESRQLPTPRGHL